MVKKDPRSTHALFKAPIGTWVQLLTFCMPLAASPHTKCFYLKGDSNLSSGG